MGSIDDIIAGGAKTNANFDFGSIADAFYKGKDERAKNDLRDAFKPTADNPNGVPMMPDGTTPDVAAMAKTFFQKGDFASGTALLGQAQNASERSLYAGGGSPQTAQPIPGNPPSPNRIATVSVAPSLNKGGVAPQGGQGDGQVTPASYLQSQGIQPGYNMEVGLSYFKRNGIDPDQPFNPNDPKISAQIGPMVQRIKGVGQVQPQQPGDQGAPPPQVGQQQPIPQQPPQQTSQPPQMAPQQQPAPQGFQPSPQQVAAQNDPELKRLRFMAGSPDKNVAESARAELKSLIESRQPTTEMRNAAAPGLLERQGEQAAQQAGAVEMAKTRVAQYQQINEAGDKAIAEIPKLQLALKLMDDPNYYSGALNQYNLGAKRLVAALGGDPEKAAPQEIVNKIAADSILTGMGALKGLGPIRVAEMKILSQASLSPDNSIPAQKFLANMAIKIQERAAKVSDMAQNYNEGVLDNGFDRQIRADDKKNPIFTPEEARRFYSIRDGKEKASPSQQPQGQQSAQGQRSAAAPPAAFPNAKQAPDGQFYVPDPNRAGKYMRVIQ